MQEQLLLCLLTHSTHVSGPELAKSLKTSSKTIYRLVREINAEQPGDPVIESRRGIGYRLVMDAYLRRVHALTSRVKGGSVTPTERRKRILREMLHASPRGMIGEELCAAHFISDSQLRADLKAIDAVLSTYRLTIRQRRARWVVEGPEAFIRSALSRSLQVADMGVLALAGSHVAGGINEQDLAFARGEVEFITTELGSVLPPPYDINLVTHLYVLVARTRGGANPSSDVQPLFTADATNPAHSRYAAVASKVLEHVETYLGRRVPPAEASYVFAYLASSRIEEPIPPVVAADEAAAIVQEVADAMSHRQGVHFGSERLLSDLAGHVRPMLNRVRFGMYVSNPVLAQVEHSYPELLADLREVTSAVGSRYGLPEIPIDEIGYMCLYFARELELCATPVRALVVCSSGVGTSELLRVKVERHFREIAVVDVLSVGQLAAAIATGPAVDLVITTVGPPAPIDIPLVLVDAMFSAESQDRVRATLRRLR